MSLIGLLCTLFVFAIFFWLAIRIVPTMLEFWAIEKAIAASKVVSKTPADLRVAFDKIAECKSHRCCRCKIFSDTRFWVGYED
jgi:hypothetical protein